ncbi:MAG: flagellar motor switch protein FliG [Desulfobacterales bacterium]
MTTLPAESLPLPGSLKAAILIRSMGEQAAAGLLNRLTPEERERIQRHLKQVGNPPPELVDRVAREFTMLARQGRGGAAPLPAASPAAPGGGQAPAESEGMKALSALSAEEIYELIKDEHPQTLAIVLIHLKTAVASEVLSRMPDEIKTDVAMRVAGMDKIVGSMVDEVNRVFQDLLRNKKSSTATFKGGIDRLAEILNQTDEISSELILNEIEEANPELAAQIKQKMFVFEDLVLVDDRGFQKLLRRVETKELAVALKAASDEVKQKVFKNMSERAAEMLREEMETLGPVRMKEVSDAQQAITAIIQEMEAKGELIISGRRGEEIVT